MLLAHSEATPEAAASYCDITGFGDRETTITQPSVTGPAAGRQLALLHHHHSAVAFRGLTRTDAVRRAGGVRRNAVEDVSADTTFMAAIARAGELHRVPRALYRKRYHARNAHVEWSAWPLEKRAHGGVVHCADMLEQAILAGATLEERRLLWLAAAGRLVSSVAVPYLDAGALSPAERRSLVRRFLSEVREVRGMDVAGLLDMRWRQVRRMTERFLRPASPEREAPS